MFPIDLGNFGWKQLALFFSLLSCTWLKDKFPLSSCVQYTHIPHLHSCAKIVPLTSTLCWSWRKILHFPKNAPAKLDIWLLLCELQLCNICYWAGVFYISYLYCRAKLTTVKSFICGFFLAWYFPITLSSPAWSHTDSRGVASSWCQSRCSHKGTCYDVQVLAVIISFVVVVVWLHYWWCKLIW